MKGIYSLLFCITSMLCGSVFAVGSAYPLLSASSYVAKDREVNNLNAVEAKRLATMRGNAIYAKTYIISIDKTAFQYPSISLVLPNGKTVVFTRAAPETTPWDASASKTNPGWLGTDDSGSTLSLGIQPLTHVSGSISVGNTTYRLTSINDKFQAITEMDMTAMPSEGNDTRMVPSTVKGKP